LPACARLSNIAPVNNEAAAAERAVMAQLRPALDIAGTFDDDPLPRAGQ
jgi:hypothetical protein